MPQPRKYANDAERQAAYRQRHSALKRMKSLRKSGMTFDAIANTLNGERIKSRSGGIWYAATVNKTYREHREAKEVKLDALRQGLRELRKEITRRRNEAGAKRKLLNYIETELDRLMVQT